MVNEDLIQEFKNNETATVYKQIIRELYGEVPEEEIEAILNGLGGLHIDHALELLQKKIWYLMGKDFPSIKIGGLWGAITFDDVVIGSLRQFKQVVGEKIKIMDGVFSFNIEGEDIVIDEADFDELGFKYTSKEYFLDCLKDWITEAEEPDLDLMIDDLCLLKSVPDVAIFSSLSTNEYVIKSEDKKAFNELMFRLFQIVKGRMLETK